MKFDFKLTFKLMQHFLTFDIKMHRKHSNKYKTFHAIYWLKIIDLFRNTNDSLFGKFLKPLLLLKSLGKILFFGINIKIYFNFSLKDIFN
jgi:hypothetical protein